MNSRLCPGLSSLELVLLEALLGRQEMALAGRDLSIRPVVWRVGKQKEEKTRILKAVRLELLFFYNHTHKKN